MNAGEEKSRLEKENKKTINTTKRKSSQFKQPWIGHLALYYQCTTTLDEKGILGESQHCQGIPRMYALTDIY